MKPLVYLETTIVSYLAARQSRDIIVAGQQQVTRTWWERRRAAFSIVVSELVLQEAGRGDVEAAVRRLEFLRGLPLAPLTDATTALSKWIVTRVPLPRRAAADALHVAAAATTGARYLLTWNCAHIANAMLRPRIESACREFGANPPVICTPDELMERPRGLTP